VARINRSQVSTPLGRCCDGCHNGFRAQRLQRIVQLEGRLQEPAQARRIAGALNRRAMETLPYVPLGYYWQPSVWRRNVTNVFRTPATVFWGMGKS
jgi:peptide/nickel transport system substrate-binding protein